MRFDIQKVFGDSIEDNNAKKLFQRSLTLPGVDEFKFVNFLSAHLYILDFFYFIKERLLLYYRKRLTSHKLPDIFLHILNFVDHGLADFLQ